MTRPAVLALVPLLLAASPALLPALADAPSPGSFSTIPGQSCTEAPCLRWTARYTGPQDEAAYTAVALGPDGSAAYVAGGFWSDETSDDLVVASYDVRTGALRWSDRYDGPRSSSDGAFMDPRARQLAVSPDGTRVVVAAASRGMDASIDIVALAYDASTGARLWENRHNGGAFHDDRPAGLAIAQGIVAVAGWSEEPSTDRLRWALLGYDLATGAAAWTRTVASPCGSGVPYGIVAAGPGFVAGGFTTACEELPGVGSSPTEFQLAAIGLDAASGAQAWWLQQHDALAVAGSVLLRGFVTSGDGRILVTGGLTRPADPGEQFDTITMALTVAGVPLWRARYDTGGDEKPMGVATSPDGSRHFVVATSPGLAAAGVADQNEDIVAFAYDAATGATLWTTRVDTSPQGFERDGRLVLAEGRDDAGLGGRLQPALLESGTRLLLSTLSQDVPLLGELGEYGEPTHVTLVLDTTDGTLAAHRVESFADVPDEAVFAALHDRADYVAAGWGGTPLAPVAQVRRLTLDIEAPLLALPPVVHAAATSVAGSTVSYTAAATDERPGAVQLACVSASGSAFAPGTSTVSCSAEDASGNRASASFPVHVRFAWSGLQGDVVEGAELPRAPPAIVRFQLAGASAAIQDLPATFWVRPAAGGAEQPAVRYGNPSTENTFSFHQGAYEFRWNTLSLPAGDYVVRVELRDGTHNTASVRLA